MPFKQDVIALVDEVEASARAIHSVNTIVNNDGRLTASNTDYIAVQRLIDEHGLDPDDAVLIRGSGGMASAVAAAFRDKGFHSGIVVARNRETGRALADRLGYEYAAEFGTCRRRSSSTSLRSAWPVRPKRRKSRSTKPQSPRRTCVFDVVALPSETPLIKAARAAGVDVITGAEVIALQAAEQFERYTGVRPTPEQIAEASAISRA